MKNYVMIILALITITATTGVMAQNAKKVKLTQTDGEFETKSLELKEGVYVFEVHNVGVDHPLGFVLVPKGMYDEEHHIKEAYVQKMINDGESSTSKEVKLAKGEYEYFCPLNPTPHYTLVVK